MSEDAVRRLVAGRLREARERAGLSQGQIARLLGMHRPAVSEIEAGRRRVSAEELTAFASQYGVSLEWLTGGEATTELSADVAIAARQLERLKPDDRERVRSFIRSLSRATTRGR